MTKISYTSKKTINLGNYESKSIEISIEKEIDFERYSLETEYNLLKDYVETKLSEALKEKQAGTCRTTTKVQESQESQESQVSEDKELDNLEELRETLKQECLELKLNDFEKAKSVKDYMLKSGFKTIKEMDLEGLLSLQEYILKEIK